MYTFSPESRPQADGKGSVGRDHVITCVFVGVKVNEIDFTFQLL